MLSFERVTARNLYLVGTFQPTPSPPPWIAEVEAVAYGPGAVEAVLSDEIVAWFLYADQETIGVVIHHPAHPKRFAELLHVLVVDYPRRGRGEGLAVLTAALQHVVDQSAFDYVVWLVHPDNEPMNNISRRVAPDAPAVDSRGNYLYTWP